MKKHETYMKISREAVKKPCFPCQEAAFWSLMMVLAVLIQIPLSVYVLNLKISTSGALRAL